jgi:hypothetical protein
MSSFSFFIRSAGSTASWMPAKRLVMSWSSATKLIGRRPSLRQLFMRARNFTSSGVNGSIRSVKRLCSKGNGKQQPSTGLNTCARVNEVTSDNKEEQQRLYNEFNCELASSYVRGSRNGVRTTLLRARSPFRISGIRSSLSALNPPRPLDGSASRAARLAH